MYQSCFRQHCSSDSKAIPARRPAQYSGHMSWNQQGPYRKLPKYWSKQDVIKAHEAGKYEI